MNISVYKENAGISDDHLVNPDVMQNRFGIRFCSYTMFLLERADNEKLYIPFHPEGESGFIGICLSELKKEELKALAKFIFTKYKSLKQITYEYYPQKFGLFSRNYPTNHWHIQLPKTKEELWERVSAKSRQTLRRKHNHLVNHFGSEPVFVHYSIEDGISDEVVEVFFQFKKELMNRDYGMTAQEYLKHYFVTDAYIWKINSDSDKITDHYLSIVFTCEQGKNVYLENLTYNPLWQKDSPGFLLYSKVVEELIQKGKKEFFLGKLYLDYKQKFNSINTLCFDAIVFRSFVVYAQFVCKKIIKRFLKMLKLRNN